MESKSEMMTKEQFVQALRAWYSEDIDDIAALRADKALLDYALGCDNCESWNGAILEEVLAVFGNVEDVVGVVRETHCCACVAYCPCEGFLAPKDIDEFAAFQSPDAKEEVPPHIWFHRALHRFTDIHYRHEGLSKSRHVCIDDLPR